MNEKKIVSAFFYNLKLIEIKIITERISSLTKAAA